MNFSSREEELATKNFIISLLVKQANADQEFSVLEKKYLDYAGQVLEMTQEQLEAIRRNPDSYTISPPPDEAKRMTVLYYLLFMMRADGQTNPQEERLCYLVGFQLGFREEMITNLISLMKTYLNANLPPNAMLERIKPYLN